MLELNKIYNMDCLDGLRLLDDCSVDIIITDPPYSSGTRQQTDRTPKKEGAKWNGAGLEWDSCFSNFVLEQFMRKVLCECKRVLKDGGHLYMFTDWRQYPMFVYIVESSGFYLNNMIVWDKGVYALGSNYRSQHELIIFGSKGVSREINNYVTGNVLVESRESNSINKFHPTQKPVALVRRLLNVCARQQDVICDPFIGGGSVAIAAKQLNLNFIGFEICQKYCEVCIERLSQTNISGTLSAYERKERICTVDINQKVLTEVGKR